MDLFSGHRFSRNRWPRILKHLKLRSLRIEASNPLGSDGMVRQELSSLFSGIQRLSLRFDSVCQIVFDLNQTFDSDGPPPPKRPKYSEEDASQMLSKASIMNIAALFPQLEYLELSEGNRYDFKLGKAHWEYLPKTLSSLTLAVPSIGSLEGLPESLTMIDVPTLLLDMANLQSLPTSLTKIRGYFRDREAIEYLLSAAGMRQLPNLDPFPFKCYSGHDLLDVMQEHGNWPEKTRKVSVNLTGALLESEQMPFPLPMGLTSILISLDGFNPIKFALPATVSKFYTDSIAWKDLSEGWASTAQCAFPASLTSLSLSNETFFGIDYFILLPRGLRHLEVRSGACGDGIDANGDPTDYYERIGREALAGVDRAQWSKIRKLAKKDTHNLRYSKENLRAISNGSLYGLPLTLTSLQLVSTNPEVVASEVTSVLPPYVTEAQLPNDFCSKIHFFLRTLPPSITDLTIPDASNDHPLSIDSWTTLITSDWASYGARNLLSLHLVYIDCNITPQLFKSLPQSLTTFSSSNTCDLKLSLLQDLPPNIRSLTLFHSLISYNWPKYLPRQLTTAIFPNAVLHATHIHEIPQHLEVLSVSCFAGLDSAHLSLFPESLKFIEGAFCEDHSLLAENDTNAFQDPRFEAFSFWDYMLRLKHLFPKDRGLSYVNMEEISKNYLIERNADAKADIDSRVVIVV